MWFKTLLVEIAPCAACAITVAWLSGCSYVGDEIQSEVAQDGNVIQPNAQRPSDEWVTYTDPRFDLSFELPARWTLKPRSGNPDAIGEVITISAPASPEGRRYSVEIGHFLKEIGPLESLPAWERGIPTEFEASEISTSFKHESVINGSQALYVRGASPITEYQYTIVRHGAVVWLVWANWGDTDDAEHGEVFRRISASFRTGQRTPRALIEVLDSNRRSDPTSVRGSRFDTEPAGPLSIAAQQADLGSGWWAPLLKNASGQWSVTCGSNKHTNGAYYAADVQAPLGYQVLAAKAGQVEYAALNTVGYGNVLKIGPTGLGTGKRHLYAHLQGIFWPMQTVGYNVIQGETIGWVGDTGGVPVHLHFHVQNGKTQDTSTGVSLVGMTGFTDNANDSYYPSNDGHDHYNCAWMGR